MTGRANPVDAILGIAHGLRTSKDISLAVQGYQLEDVAGGLKACDHALTACVAGLANVHTTVHGLEEQAWTIRVQINALGRIRRTDTNTRPAMPATAHEERNRWNTWGI
ncbi:hypothetical protein [Bifidobacterium sp. UTBIF-68]|uniref:hypothetical protein n=1 Tax=Bifidobacterium sp. UTBIF-68 TaxID=1465262 RepID=UPI00215922A1|nr:hypothetical protein [Bifidobacterium sp. UTBIF-68]